MTNNTKKTRNGWSGVVTSDCVGTDYVVVFLGMLLLDALFSCSQCWICSWHWPCRGDKAGGVTGVAGLVDVCSVAEKGATQ